MLEPLEQRIICKIGNYKYTLPLVALGYLLAGVWVCYFNNNILGGEVMFFAGIFTAWAFHQFWHRQMIKIENRETIDKVEELKALVLMHNIKDTSLSKNGESHIDD